MFNAVCSEGAGDTVASGASGIGAAGAAPRGWGASCCADVQGDAGTGAGTGAGVVATPVATSGFDAGSLRIDS